LPTSVLNTSDVARAVRKLAGKHGGAASIAELRAELDLSERTLHRGLSRLVAAGTLFRVSRDRYSDNPPAGAPTGEAKKIVRVIERLADVPRVLLNG
jgi:predicted transcriptional regulator of viral defense system